MFAPLVSLLLATASATSAAESAPSLTQATRWVMGTHLRVVIADPNLAPDDARRAMDAAFEEVERWNSLLSHYDSSTPLSQINARAGAWVEIPQDLHGYLRRCKTDAARTDGVFDVTFAGSPAGIDRLQLESKGDLFRAKLERRGMALDPGGNGKGVALDHAVAVLKQHGVENALLEFGGSSWFGLGHPPEAATWSVAVRGPNGEIAGRIELMDQALSTSSALRRDVSEPGDPTPHIVDPRSALAVTRARVTSVVSPSSVDAEVLSTALVVEGRGGFRWLERFEGAGAVLINGEDPPRLSEAAFGWFRIDTKE